MKKKMIATVLVIAITMALTVPAFAAAVTDFTDVPANAWYHDYVRIACDKGLISGTSGTTFSPNDTMTRGQFVTVLGRYAGVDVSTIKYSGSFTDVIPSAYYTPYIAWAASNGIVTGVTCDVFEPDTAITREQMATLLVRYADSEGISIPADDSINFVFGDASAISDYAKSAVETLKLAGILTGDENRCVNPQRAINRAEATAMLVRFIDVLEKDDPDFIGCTIIYATILNDSGYATSKMTVGEQRRISVRYVPENTTIDRTCTYVSGDTSILIVDDTGLVTAVSVGKSYVTVTASNGLTAVCGIEVRGTEQKLTGFEPAWGSKWDITTYTCNDGIEYYSYDWTMMGRTSAVTREIGNDSGFLLLSPQAVYSDGFKQIVLPESYGGYKFSFTSSDPSLVSVNVDSSITVHRAIGTNEESRTVIITIYSGYFETSKTVTITLSAG